MTDNVPVFEINGREYEWPGIVGLTTREARIFYQETGVVWESIWLDDLTVRDLFMREGFLSAMARIAYVREHPEALDDDVKAIIDRQPRMSLFSTLLQATSFSDGATASAASTVDAVDGANSAAVVSEATASHESLRAQGERARVRVVIWVPDLARRPLSLIAAGRSRSPVVRGPMSARSILAGRGRTRPVPSSLPDHPGPPRIAPARRRRRCPATPRAPRTPGTAGTGPGPLRWATVRMRSRYP